MFASHCSLSDDVNFSLRTRRIWRFNVFFTVKDIIELAETMGTALKPTGTRSPVIQTMLCGTAIARHSGHSFGKAIPYTKVPRRRWQLRAHELQRISSRTRPLGRPSGILSGIIGVGGDTCFTRSDVLERHVHMSYQSATTNRHTWSTSSALATT